MKAQTDYDVVIVGGGTAGITVAARLRKQAPELSVAIIEPSDKHYYQPLWTLVGAGATDFQSTEKNESDVIPKGVLWIKDKVEAFQPDQNTVLTAERQSLTYKYLVVAPGIQIDWNKIDGLTETLGKNGVCSNYSKDTVKKTC